MLKSLALTLLLPLSTFFFVDAPSVPSDAAPGQAEFAITSDSSTSALADDDSDAPPPLDCGKEDFVLWDGGLLGADAPTLQGAFDRAMQVLQDQFVTTQGVSCAACDVPGQCKLSVTLLAQPTLWTYVLVPAHIDSHGNWWPDLWTITYSYSGWVKYACSPCDPCGEC